ncbi:glycosyltransferase family protein [Listeria newyorkensis]|uniref:Glycosyltransferase n=1 Tax=Listeria newyorkensis TaxID=1497681 RepID=A0A841YWF3_9LIST|nr:glycosyltransferase [Listeria newyorkensis]MBC1457635.1 glycosyltransferase [Listeria newyorkensis]
MKKIENLYHEIEYLQKKILSNIQPEVIASKDFTNADNWHSSNDNLAFEQHGEAVMATNSIDKYIYFSYLETNLLFSRYPMHIIETVPGEKFDFRIDIDMNGKQECKIAVIEYGNKKQLKSTLFDPNKENHLKVGQETTRLRIALRVPGKTVIEITGCEFIRTFDAAKATKKAGETVVETRAGLKSITKTADLRVACIFDEFTRTCYDKEVNLITFTPDDWQEVLEREQPHILMVESAWHGNHKAWEYKIGRYANQDRSALLGLLEWCKQNDVPTIFWNKEDPIHYDKFIDTAKLFNYIYTTDADMIPKYKKAAGHENVFAQSFAVQPEMHNPIKLYKKRIDKMCFAGSYYANRHEDRRRDMDQILDVTQQYGLAIYDRNFERHSPDFQFPERFLPSVLGSLAYNDMDIAYKGYKYMLNINSIKESPTMFSRRVFEGLACGTPIISSYSKGIKRMFGDLVLIAEDEDTLKEKIQEITTDDALYQQKSLEGIREVYHHHTYKHRLRMMLANMGITLDVTPKAVTVLSVVHSEADIKAVKANFDRQTYSNKKLVLFASMFDGVTGLMNEYNTEDVSMYAMTYVNHYQKLHDIIQTEYMSYMAGEHFYGEQYLADLFLATEYTKADVIGKKNFFEWENGVLQEDGAQEDYEFVSGLTYHRALMKTEIPMMGTVPVLLGNMENDGSMAHYFRQGVSLFSSDKFNFVAYGAEAPTSILTKVEI